MSDVLERFLRYITYDTQSDPHAKTYPSTAKQFALLNALSEELAALGIDAEVSENGVLYALIPATAPGIPAVGFIAHVDTSPDYSGQGVKARITKAYPGGPIVLDSEEGVVMDDEAFPELAAFIGEDVITTDGSTLLGADDKAGVAEIMAAARAIVEEKAFPHGPIAIGFTPDEEIGAGIANFDVARFGAEVGYTVDGGLIGSYNYENFNAINVRVTIRGLGVHPGAAKGKMKNAVRISSEFLSMLPYGEVPETTEGYEGFVHFGSISGDADLVTLDGIVRDHDPELLRGRMGALYSIERFLNERYGEGAVKIEAMEMYRNMKELVDKRFDVVQKIIDAHEELGIPAKAEPMRGGTDGAMLTFEGLICPNIATGGINAHGRYEAISVQAMEASVDVILKIIELYGRQH